MKDSLRQTASHLLVFIVLLCVLILNTSYNTVFAGGSSAVCYNSSLSPGLTSSISNSFKIWGYPGNRHADPETSWTRIYLSERTLYFHHTHGSPASFQTKDGSFNYAKALEYSNKGLLNLQNSSLIFISSCQTGNPNASGQDLIQLLRNKGSRLVLSYKKNISASTDSNGIHRFNVIMLNNLKQYNDTNYAYARAKETFALTAGGSRDYGQLSFRISGGGGIN